MRIGNNPTKEDTGLELATYHRIILPVYIPNFENYFKDSERIFKACINSLLASVHPKCAISIINNGCNSEILNYLRELRDQHKIDRLIDAAENRGKIDPLIGEIRATYEPYITVADADVLFKPNWITEVESIFKHIPVCGMVGHLPDPKKYKGFNATTLLHTLLLGKLGKEKVSFLDELNVFAKSIGEAPEGYVQQEIYTCKLGGIKTAIGAHHFSATLRREFLVHVPEKPSLKKITGNSEYHYIDRPVDEGAYLRLSPIKPVVWHMGNVWEDWMETSVALDGTFIEPKAQTQILPAKKSFTNALPYKVRTLAESLIFRTSVKKLIDKIIKS